MIYVAGILLIILVGLFGYGMVSAEDNADYVFIAALIGLVLTILSIKITIDMTEESILKAMIKDNKIEYRADPSTGEAVTVLKDSTCINVYNMVKDTKD